jgi:ATP-dependent Lhr-like helicase
VAVQAGADIRLLAAVESKSEWEIRNLLVRRQRPGSYVEAAKTPQ